MLERDPRRIKANRAALRAMSRALLAILPASTALRGAAEPVSA